MNAGWVALQAAIAEASALVAARAPDADTAAEGEAYVTRIVAAGLMNATLGNHLRADGLARAVPVYGGPNPDYILRHAQIDAAGRYRLEGRLNGSERVGVGLYTIGRNGAPLIAGYRAFDRVNCAADGGFALEIAADAGPDGLVPAADVRILLVRILHRGDGPPADLALAGAVASPLALAGGDGDAALRFVAGSLAGTVREYLKWTDAAAALANRLDRAPPELTATVQGDADTAYYLGGFDLAEGEELEVTMPPDLTGYWSLHAYSYWYEHLRTAGVHDRNAVAEEDGSVRILVGPVPTAAAANRIDTAGRRRGAFVCRVIGGGGRPTTRIVVRG